MFDRLLLRPALLLTIALCVGCQSNTNGPAPSKTAAAVPTVRATVITIKTTNLPEKRDFTRTIVIAGDRARDTSEHDVWRLFDTKAKNVTFVDEINGTARSESLQALIDTRRTEFMKPLPAHYPPARILRPASKRTFLDVPAELFAIESGRYRRELWFGEHPSIPTGLFAMMHASEPATLPLAPMLRAVDEVLIAARGFPLSDRAEVPIAKEKVIVESVVLSVTTKDVPASLFELPKGITLTQPKPATTTATR